MSAAGNKGADPSPALQYIQNRSYNGLIVGGCDDRGTAQRSDDTIWTGSSWRNHSTPNGDRELPEIVASAKGVTAAGVSGSGTSLAAPAVAGAVAIVNERNPGLTWWPEVQKAIVMAATDCNVDGPVLDLMDTTDDRDGVGLLNVTRASDLASSSNNRNSTNLPVPNGYMYGTMNFTSDFTSNRWNSSQYLTTGATGSVNIVLAWDATPVCTSSSSCTRSGSDADLGLLVYENNSGALVTWSFSFDNNYEVVRRVLTPNTTYRIDVYRSSNVQASTYYGLAWSTFASECTGP